MKLFILSIGFIFFQNLNVFSYSLKNDNCTVNYLRKDSIIIDSVSVNKKFENKLKEMLIKNEKDIKSNGFVLISISNFSKSKNKNIYLLETMFMDDYTDYFNMVKNKKICFFKISDVPVFILSKDVSKSIIFKKTTITKVYYFEIKNEIKMCMGNCNTYAGYKVKEFRTKVHINRLYYIRHNPSIIQSFYYKIFYRKYY